MELYYLRRALRARFARRLRPDAASPQRGQRSSTERLFLGP